MCILQRHLPDNFSPLTFGTIFGTRKLFSRKIHSRGKLSKYYTSRVLYIPLFSPKSPIFGTKTPNCRRFLQHYYRDTFIESHRKPRVLLEISYGGRLICSMLALIPQSGDFSGAALGVRSVALLQVAYLPVTCYMITVEKTK